MNTTGRPVAIKSLDSLCGYKDIFYYGSWEPKIEDDYGEEIFLGFQFSKSREVRELINTYNPSVRDMRVSW